MSSYISRRDCLAYTTDVLARFPRGLVTQTLRETNAFSAQQSDLRRVVVSRGQGEGEDNAPVSMRGSRRVKRWLPNIVLKFCSTRPGCRAILVQLRGSDHFGPDLMQILSFK
ncbi:hypothetical protein BDBG_09534 [Blastomyces gilchristii SLH14081]|uniref:Uncharacterized protein n=2 Tax=Blastomyces TaxID=229219 RepID=A0A179V5B0_BLAGS|nr:uncharacterized protein BDBG_09534 [Blastomyces gilchristii SLH14081]EGE85310.1 hypothetical protein BDDG_08255 [Blastomyces dermatitidis ATCC 18188]OAT14541.1 hypothetical protein BDBG_09534 [Blastomyces gilchristii SLH14081]